MTRTAVIIIIVAIVSVFIGVQVYDNQMIPATKKIQTRCDNPKHQGDRVITTDKKPTIAKRKDARREIVEVQSVTCLACQKRQEQEFQVARERADADALLSHLDYHFSFGYYAGSGYVREKSLRPGDGINFCLNVRNKGSEVIDGLKIVIEPKSYLYLMPFREDSAFDRALHNEHVAYDKEDRELLRRMTTTGMTIYDRAGRTQLFPSGSVYYPENEGDWSADRGLRGKGQYYAFHGRLALNPNLQPGQDVQFQGHLLYKSKRILIGTVTVHVMYPD